MIIIENTMLEGWEAAIRGMRNPMNSWDKSDSKQVNGYLEDENTYIPSHYDIGANDWKLMKKLCNGGSDDRKFLRMIVVWVDITAPLYWWKEFDTYKVGTVANSCSTMHKIHAKEFALDDFSNEHLFNDDYDGNRERRFRDILLDTIECLNQARMSFITTKDKKYWYQMIQLLPSSYNQKRTVMLNYEVLRNMYQARKNHKLNEWHYFCHWIETMPYSTLITGERQVLDQAAQTCVQYADNPTLQLGA